MKAPAAYRQVAPPRAGVTAARLPPELSGAEAAARMDAAVEEACRPLLNQGHLASQADGSGERLGELAVRSVAAGLIELGVITGGRAWRAELEAVPGVATLFSQVQRSLNQLLKVRLEEMQQGRPLTRIGGMDFSFASQDVRAKERSELGGYIRGAIIDVVAAYGEELRLLE